MGVKSLSDAPFTGTYSTALIAVALQVVVVTEDTGMLAKANHDRLAASRVRELPSSRAGVAEMLLDKDLLSRLEPCNGTAHSTAKQQRKQASSLSSGQTLILPMPESGLKTAL